MLFNQTVQRSHRDRWVGAGVGLLAGGGLLATGLAFSETEPDWRNFFIISGAVSMGASVLTLFIPRPVERVGEKYHVDQTGHTSEQRVALERDWEELASQERTGRYIGGVAGLVTGGLTMGIGISIVDGASNPDEQSAGAVLLGASGALLGLSVVAFFLRGPSESSFEDYQALRASKTAPSASALRLGVGVNPLPGGAGFALTGIY